MRIWRVNGEMAGQVKPPTAEDGARNGPAAVDVTGWDKLTPRRLLSIAGRMTISSWVSVIGIPIGLAIGAFSLGWSYRDGALPDLSYVFHPDEKTPRDQRLLRENTQAFTSAYSNLVDWKTLRAVASSIEKEKPDGLDTQFEIAASFLAQVRATRGQASFLAGNTQTSVKIIPGEDGFNFEWNKSPSIVPRIAQDAGVELSDDDLRTLNSNLNWAQFGYVDDEMERIVIFKSLDGSLSMTIRE